MSMHNIQRHCGNNTRDLRRRGNTTPKPYTSLTRSDIVSVSIRKGNSPYYTKPKTVDSSVDTLIPLHGTVVLSTLCITTINAINCTVNCATPL